MIFSLKELDEKCKSRPQGYREDIMKVAIPKGDNQFEIKPEDYSILAAKYRPPTSFEKMLNVSQALKLAISDPTRRSKEEIKDILEKSCHTCEWFIQDKIICGKCGCYLGVKTSIKAFHCPLNKW
jgi:hypothetical protein